MLPWTLNAELKIFVSDIIVASKILWNDNFGSGRIANNLNIVGESVWHILIDSEIFWEMINNFCTWRTIWTLLLWKCCWAFELLSFTTSTLTVQNGTITLFSLACFCIFHVCVTARLPTIEDVGMTNWAGCSPFPNLRWWLKSSIAFTHCVVAISWWAWCWITSPIVSWNSFATRMNV